MLESLSMQLREAEMRRTEAERAHQVTNQIKIIIKIGYMFALYYRYYFCWTKERHHTRHHVSVRRVRSHWSMCESAMYASAFVVFFRGCLHFFSWLISVLVSFGFSFVSVFVSIATDLIYFVVVGKNRILFLCSKIVFFFHSFSFLPLAKSKFRSSISFLSCHSS